MLPGRRPVGGRQAVVGRSAFERGVLLPRRRHCAELCFHRFSDFESTAARAYHGERASESGKAPFHLEEST